jgi:hypothetical protein
MNDHLDENASRATGGNSESGFGLRQAQAKEGGVQS